MKASLLIMLLGFLLFGSALTAGAVTTGPDGPPTTQERVDPKVPFYGAWLKSAFAKTAVVGTSFADQTRSSRAEQRLERRVRRKLGVDDDNREGLAIASFALGIAGLIILIGGIAIGTGFAFVGLAPSILAIVLGAIALRRHKEGYVVNRGLATSGLVLGIIGAVLMILLGVIVLAIAAAWG